jgi:hypothetical protein
MMDAMNEYPVVAAKPLSQLDPQPPVGFGMLVSEVRSKADIRVPSKNRPPQFAFKLYNRVLWALFGNLAVGLATAYDRDGGGWINSNRCPPSVERYLEAAEHRIGDHTKDIASDLYRSYR